MPAPLMSKAQVVERLYETFRDHGYESASLAELSKETGLGKSSLYHYFPGGKEEMALEVLDYVDTAMKEHMFGPLRDEGSPEERLAKMLDMVGNVYAQGKKSCILGTLSSGQSRHRFQARLKAIFVDWMRAFEELLVSTGLGTADARVRAEDAVIRIQGALVLSAALGDNGPFRRVLEDLRTGLLENRRSDGPLPRSE